MSDRKRQTNVVRPQLRVESKKAQLTEIEERKLPGDGEWGKWGDIGQRAQTPSWKVSKS